MNGKIKYINPEGLLKNPAFSQAVITEGNGKTIYIGGQNAVNAKHEIVGKGDLQAQTEHVLKNLQTVLMSCGGSFTNIVKLYIHIVQGQNPHAAFQASQKFMSTIPHPPAISVLMVAGLANPDFLIEISATAFIPE